jgi:hypothetical protein
MIGRGDREKINNKKKRQVGDGVLEEALERKAQ